MSAAPARWEPTAAYYPDDKVSWVGGTWVCKGYGVTSEPGGVIGDWVLELTTPKVVRPVARAPGGPIGPLTERMKMTDLSDLNPVDLSAVLWTGPDVLVRMGREFIERIFIRDHNGNRLKVVGLIPITVPAHAEPEYSLTLETDYADNPQAVALRAALAGWRTSQERVHKLEHTFPTHTVPFESCTEPTCKTYWGHEDKHVLANKAARTYAL